MQQSYPVSIIFKPEFDMLILVLDWTFLGVSK